MDAPLPAVKSTEIGLEQSFSKTLCLLATFTTWDDIAVLAFLALSAIGYITRHHHLSKPDPYNYLWYQRPQQSETDPTELKRETRDVAKKLDEDGKQIVIFWGSQSGTAERFAHELKKTCLSTFNMDALVADLSDFDPESIASIGASRLAIFILSTFGEGDPSDNAIDFMKWLTIVPTDALNSIRYAAFGLGNSNYKFYNKVVDTAVESLNKAGALQVLPTGRADHMKGLPDEDFLEWTQKLILYFKSGLGLEESTSVYHSMTKIDEANCPAPMSIELERPVNLGAGKKVKTGISPLKAFPVKVSRNLLKGRVSEVFERRCVHMEFDLSGLPEIKYKTGDHLAIWPVNPDEEVDRLLLMLGLRARRDVPITIQPLSNGGQLNTPALSTVSALFQYHVDICSPVSRKVVLALEQFAPKPEIRSFLTDIANSKDAYTDFLKHHHVNFGRLLELTGVDWAHLPLSFVIESLGPLLPRYYSISSSSIVDPRHPSITAIVDKAPLSGNADIKIPGLATSYLSAMTPLSETETAAPKYPPREPKAYLYAQIRRSKFKLPTSNLTPLILVAGGTGIAPFRGFLQERARLASMGREIGSILLVFGCRTPMEDFIYGEEIEGLAKSALKGKLSVQTAFSRSDSHPKLYVQDRLCHPDNISDVFDLLLYQSASLYVCGSAIMGRGVTANLAEKLRSQLFWNEDKTKDWFDMMRKTRRHQEDVWG